MFQVIWLQRAVNDLAGIWMQADSAQRRAITQAANAIDRELGHDPFHSSESREEDLRVMFAPPLGVFFQVELSSRTVHVAHIWRYRGHGKSAGAPGSGDGFPNGPR